MTDEPKNTDPQAPAQPSSPAAPEPASPQPAESVLKLTPELSPAQVAFEAARHVRIGDQVMVTLGWTPGKRPIRRPAKVVAVWPGEFGHDEPPAVNVQVFLDGMNDNTLLATDQPLGLGLPQARRQLVCETGILWLTSLRYGEGVRLWMFQRY